ncbi:MAG: choice-of-anchor Q domain-containing protein [Candidatus Rokuibacteriota bacterium]
MCATATPRRSDGYGERSPPRHPPWPPHRSSCRTSNRSPKGGHMFTQRVLTSLVLSGLLILAAGAPAVDAAVLTLDACTPEALRALIAGAVGGDVLLLPACTIFVAGASGDDANASGDFDVTTSITLQGVGPGATILDGGGLDRVLDIRPGATVVVADLTVRNGAAALVDEDGGGIRNEGTTTIINVVITGNTAADDGGGIYNLGTLTVTGSVISNNFAGDDGGGIRSFNAGAVAVLDGSRVVGNSCGDSGGGVDNDSGTMTIRESTIADNLAADNGGGIESRSNEAPGVLVVERSTVSGNGADSGGGVRQTSDTTNTTFVNTAIAHNAADNGGGGISMSTGTLTLVNTTIARNADTSGLVDGAGGIATSGGTLNVRNTIIAQNVVGPGTPAANADVFGVLSENQSSFIGTVDGNPRLGPLQDNGGPTFTMAPFPGSPLIDTGNNALATAQGLTTDQRGAGFARLVDGDGNGTATVDRGAVEVAAATGPANVAILFLSHLAPTPGDTVVLGILIRAPGRTIVGGAALFDDFVINEPLVSCPLLAGTLITGEQTFTCSFPAFLLPPGVHIFSLFLDLDDGTTLSDTATIGG